MPQNSVIYAIVNKVNNKVYVGSTVNYPKRVKVHYCFLNNGEHPNTHLQHAWNKYGDDVFCFEILMYVPNVDDLLFYEEYWIAEMLSCNPAYGYNTIAVPSSAIGENNPFYNKKHTEESRRKMRETTKGRYVGEKNPMFGRNHTPETKENMSESHKGGKLSGEQKELLSKIFSGEGNPFYGRTHTEETRRKISKSRKGKRAGKENPNYGKKHSLETRMKIRAAVKNKTLSEDHKRKLSKALSGSRNPFYGKVHPPDIQAKILETRRRNQAKHVEGIQLTFL